VLAHVLIEKVVQLFRSMLEDEPMCGRFAITLPPEAVRSYFAFVEQPNFPPRYNVAPTQPIPVVTAKPHTGGLERHFQLVRWGFWPSFMKDPRDFPLIINARAEGIEAKPSFRAAIKRRRWIAIADAYYEWRKPPAGMKAAKTPFLIRRRSREPLAFAALGETWSDPNGGEIDTACIITTQANNATGDVHDRMPVILEPENFATWLDCDDVPVEHALDLLQPAAESTLELAPISTLVNSVANDGEALWLPQPLTTPNL
jgi:putative SOS response-associated peptidase YedK